MKIRWRLIMTYIIGLLLPLVLVLLINPSSEMAANEPDAIPLWVIGGYDYRTAAEKTELEAYFKTIQQRIQEDPEILRDTDFRLSLKEKLRDKKVYLAIDDVTKKMIVPSSDQKYWYFNADLSYGAYKMYFINVLLALLLAYLVIYGLITHWMTRSITKPLGKLKKSALHISEGDYSYRIADYSNDEIGEVSRVFDQMAENTEDLIQQRIHYDETRKQLLANISHDLKTPLAAMSVTLEALNDGIAQTPEKRAQYMSLMRGKVAHMQELIETILLFSKLDFKQEPFYYERVSVAHFLEDIIEDWQFIYPSDDIRIHIDYDPSATYDADLDLEKMRRVILNLLENSRKYAGVIPLLIKISLSETPTHIVVCLSDNGSGVKKSEVPKLTEQFYKADASRSAQHLSHGLGLSISEHIIKGHDGTMTLESDINDGFKVTFSVIKKAPNPGTTSYMPKEEANEKNTHH